MVHATSSFSIPLVWVGLFRFPSGEGPGLGWYPGHSDGLVPKTRLCGRSTLAPARAWQSPIQGTRPSPFRVSRIPYSPYRWA